jgi:hypothetical protein
MNTSDLKKSNFLKKEDVGEGALLTITGFSEENVAMEGAEPEMRVCLHFSEVKKPLVMNQTNALTIGDFLGHDNIEQVWIGKQVVLFNDPTVSYAGKRIGGIRVRAPKNVQITKADLPF